jgi:DNA-binding MarR family transcriptional regulator
VEGRGERRAASRSDERARPAGSAGAPAAAGLMDRKPAETGQRIPSLGQIGLQQFAPYLMNRIMGRYNATLSEELGRHALTVPQVRALAVLSVITDGVTINDLAVYAVIGQSTMSRTVDALEAQGLVLRQIGERDTRVRKVFLTEAGRAEFGRAWPYLAEAFEKMFDGIDDAEYAALVATLHRMLNNVRRHDI